MKPSIQTTDEQVNSEPESIKNDSSEIQSINYKTLMNKLTQSEQTNSTDPLPPQVQTN